MLIKSAEELKSFSKGEEDLLEAVRCCLIVFLKSQQRLNSFISKQGRPVTVIILAVGNP